MQASLPPRLYTVGRLDVASVGLIYVTNDGDWAQKVTHPSSGLTKEYVVVTSTEPSKRQVGAEFMNSVVLLKLLFYRMKCTCTVSNSLIF